MEHVSYYSKPLYSKPKARKTICKAHRGTNYGPYYNVAFYTFGKICAPQNILNIINMSKDWTVINSLNFFLLLFYFMFFPFIIISFLSLAAQFYMPTFLCLNCSSFVLLHRCVFSILDQTRRFGGTWNLPLAGPKVQLLVQLSTIINKYSH